MISDLCVADDVAYAKGSVLALDQLKRVRHSGRSLLRAMSPPINNLWRTAMIRTLATTAGLMLTATAALADVEGSYFTYTVAGETFEGYVAHDPDMASKGTVMIVHDWDGMTEYEETRAMMLAEQGYTAFAVDVYGADVNPQGFDEYRALTGALYGDRALFRQRLFGSLAAAADIPGATDNIVVMGYCFGGAAVLEMARAGADVDGFVSFHGGLGTPAGQDYTATSAPILLLHGSADPVSGMEDVAALMGELIEAGVPHQAEIYGGARHTFTIMGSRDYVAEADMDSWAEFSEFLGRML